MRRVILQDRGHIHPFNEPARELRVQNLPLWLWQHDLLARHTDEEREYASWEQIVRDEARDPRETLLHRDNLFFNGAFIEDFVGRARAGGRAARAALRASDPAVASHILPLSQGLVVIGELVLADLYYLPRGIADLATAEPLVVDTESREVGYYHVPTYMAAETGDLVYHLPRKALISLENWIHLFVIDVLFGVFARGKDIEDRVGADWRYRLKVLARALVEQRQVLDSSALVRTGRTVHIDPSAVVHGPTIIGDNVTIGPGAVIDNCLIGSNVNIAQGCQLMLSVVSDGCFLPFRAALFMTTLMENTMVAQNACLQLCVIGRDTFVGAGTTFTDFKVLPGKLRAATGGDRIVDTGMYVLGGCVGHHCRLSSGLTLYPARTVESDVVLLAGAGRQFITQHVPYEESDHHALKLQAPYPRLYPRPGEAA
jgi:carbonic anhydrase/acetyltransferase-like protein (isoleucine patch superfamily)